ncbi:MAG: ATP-binding protein [Pseudomonadales bacterium]
MLVHGVWVTGPWNNQLRSSLVDQLSTHRDTPIELTEHHIGFDSRTTPNIIAHHKRHIEVMMENRDYEFLVCALAAACEFAEGLELPGVKIIMLAPSPETVSKVANQPDVIIVQSAASIAARKTMEHIRQLRPNTHLHVLAGNGPTDRYYQRLVEKEISTLEPKFPYTIHAASAADSLIKVAAGLNNITDTALLASAQGYGTDEIQAFPVGALEALGESSSVPIFVFWGAAISTGNVVGGHVTAAANYGQQISELIYRLIDGEAIEPVIMGKTESIYHAPVASRWNLNVNSLPGPITFWDKPVPIWVSNPGLVIAALIATVTMALAIVLLIIFLHTSRKTSAQLEERERRAIENEARYRTLAENSQDVIWTLDPVAQKFTYINPAIKPLTGYSPEEFLAQPLQTVLTTESLEKLFMMIMGDETSAVIRLDHLHKNGQLSHFEHAIRILKTSGSRDEVIGVARDITARLHEQAQSRAVEQQAQQRQKMEALGTLAAGIAHDFNNVLGVVVGLNELTKLEVQGNQKAEALVSQQSEAAARAQRLVRRILTFTRRTAERFTDIPMQPLVAKCVEHTQTLVPENVKLSAQYESTLFVNGDAGKIEQAVLNLLTNAIEALGSNPGEVSVALYAEQPTTTQHMTVGDVTPGEYVVLEVRDTGSGMSAEEIDRGFEPFFTSKSLGSGIGLAIVHGVAMDHTGAIKVTSTPGVGTSFKLYLASATVEPSATSLPTEDTDSTVSTSAQLRVLLIDDNPELAEVLGQMIRSLGHQCELCTDPAAARQTIDCLADKLDLVLTDYSMPDIT